MTRRKTICGPSGRYPYEPKLRRFTEEFARLLGLALAEGKIPRVGRAAALAVGYGVSTWSRAGVYRTMDVSVSRALKTPSVVAYLRDLGYERFGKEWRHIGTAAERGELGGYKVS